MQAAVNIEPQIGSGAWHAVGADEVVSGLRIDPARGNDRLVSRAKGSPCSP
jgi:hypothetical protein